jgi:flavorubredoxin
MMMFHFLKSQLRRKTMREIKNNVYYCGINDRNRKYFDELIPLENGTSYNSYLIKGSGGKCIGKTALVDTTYPPKIEEFLQNLDTAQVTKLDYIIANHGEQDHTGAIPALLEKYPDAIVLTNPKCKENIVNMLNVSEEKIQIVEDGEEISLGDKTLKFIYAPWVHWPDTMFTFLKEDNMLFTCDFLGAHYTFDNKRVSPTESLLSVGEREHCKSAGFDFWAKPDEELYMSAKRYYAEIMMPFRTFCNKYTKLVREMNPDIILPSHGPIYKDCGFILDAYEDWSCEECKDLVLMPYVSMYGSTKEMVDYLAEKIEAKGTKVYKFDVIDGDLGDLAIRLVDAAAIVIGAPMVLAGPHPNVLGPTQLINALRPKTKCISVVGSYGWGGNLTGKLEELLQGLKAKEPAPVIAKGKPKAEDFAKLDELADSILETIYQSV